ncbi:MAG: ferredoxin family protein [Clostridia bacterium]|nr:ferredoxin family protein [Clostridia bacterium]
MIKVTIDQERCKGCGLCIDVCPRKLIALSDSVNQKGYHPAECTDQQVCISCAFCARMCPDSCIRVER